MGLLHSRVSRIFYAVDSRTGGLATHFQVGSNLRFHLFLNRSAFPHKIHAEPQLNHHFQVYRGLMAEECSRLPVPYALQRPEPLATQDEEEWE